MRTPRRAQQSFRGNQTLSRWKMICLVAAALALTPVSSRAAILFDGQLGTAPSSQGWFFITDPFTGALSTQTATVGWTTLDTRAQRTESAGYPGFGHPDIGTLDRSLGFTLSFDLKVIAETHVSTNRAGFSIIALASDLKGVEISFWQNQIWTQNDSPLFTHGESVNFNTTTGFIDYDLSILGNAYQLSANGNTILSGSLRDYSTFGFPYSVPNFVFMGDDTSAASSAVQIARVELFKVPEAGSVVLLMPGAVLMILISLLRRRSI